MLTTALAQGRRPGLDRLHLEAARPRRPARTATWEVKTYGNSYGGTISLDARDAASDNTVYAQLDLDLGPEEVARPRSDMGITTKLDGYPAEGLGGLKRGVSPLEMANAYATLASGGIRNRPTAIAKVVFPDGKSRATCGSPSGKRVLRPTAWRPRSTKILKMNVQAGTGTRANYRLPRGRQDRHDRQLQRRLVRRLHAAACPRRSGSATRTSARR